MSIYTCKKCGRSYKIEESGKYQCECGEKFHFYVSSSEENKNICPFCKSSIPQDAMKCAHCGEWISGSAPKSRAVYISLAVLFGNWGAAEFYAGHYGFGLLFLVLNILSFCLGKSMFIGFFIVWIIAVFTALFSNIGIEKQSNMSEDQIKKSKKVFFWIWSILVAFIISVIALTAYLIYIN